VKLYGMVTMLDRLHDVDWFAKYTARHRYVLCPEDVTLWRGNEWHLSSTAEDGIWVKICGPNADKLDGKKIRVRVEVVEEGVPDLERVGERASDMTEEFTAKWHRSRNRDEGDFMSGRRMGWADAISWILGRPQAEIREALERNEI
jgi:hypothetical protein